MVILNSWGWAKRRNIGTLFVVATLFNVKNRLLKTVVKASKSLRNILGCVECIPLFSTCLHKSFRTYFISMQDQHHQTFFWSRNSMSDIRLGHSLFLEEFVYLETESCLFQSNTQIFRLQLKSYLSSDYLNIYPIL